VDFSIKRAGIMIVSYSTVSVIAWIVSVANDFWALSDKNTRYIRASCFYATTRTKYYTNMLQSPISSHCFVIFSVCQTTNDQPHSPIRSDSFHTAFWQHGTGVCILHPLQCCRQANLLVNSDCVLQQPQQRRWYMYSSVHEQLDCRAPVGLQGHTRLYAYAIS